MIHPTQWRSGSGMAAVCRVQGGCVARGAGRQFLLPLVVSLFERLKSPPEASEIVDLQLGAPTPTQISDFSDVSRFVWIFLEFASDKVNSADRWLHLPVGF